MRQLVYIYIVVCHFVYNKYIGKEIIKKNNFFFNIINKNNAYCIAVIIWRICTIHLIFNCFRLIETLITKKIMNLITSMICLIVWFGHTGKPFSRDYILIS